MMICLQSHRFTSATPGKKLVFFGAIHGNETCGTEAMHRLVAEIEEGRIRLLKGDLLCIPVANPAAYAAGKRFMDENLNRIFKHHEVPASYEQRLANMLIDLVQDRDVLVDFHSIHTPGVPFTFRFGEVPAQEEALIQALGLPVIMQGWGEAYAASLPGVDVGQAVHTHAHFRNLGKIAAGVECGLHGDPAAAELAYTCMLRALRHFEMIDADLPKPAASQTIRMQAVYFRRSEQDTLARPFRHGEVVKKGELLITRANGAEERAPNDALVLLPRHSCPVNEEYLYLGTYL